MKTTNTTKGNETRNKLTELMNERNRAIDFGNLDDLDTINFELMQTISEIATRKTLVFLQANNATKGTETESNDNGTTNTKGFDMSVKLLNTLYHDIQLLHNPQLDPDTLSDSADLIQESNKALTPFFCSSVKFSLDDVIYTKQLKNGTVKEYTPFQFACKSIREYITKQDKRQYKKLAYCIGITDNGTEVLTTKKPKNDITDIDHDQKQKFLDKYNLTALQEEILLDTINGMTVKEIADKMQVTTRAIQLALARAKDNILKFDKRVQL